MTKPFIANPWQPWLVPVPLPVQTPSGDVAPARGRIEEQLTTGQLDDAQDGVTRRLALDPSNAEDWLLQARILRDQDRPAEASQACERALALWPDIASVHRLRLELARQAADPEATIQALRALLAGEPEDPRLCGELGWLLCQRGEYERALPHLRIAAPILLHENSTIWNYTVALALTGGYRELLEIEPMLDSLAALQATPYTPYRHLAAARLALQADRPRLVATQAALEASTLWHGPVQVLDRIARAVAAQDPFSLVCLDQDLSLLVCATSLRAHLLLRPQELLAVGSAGWGLWFATPYETAEPAFVAALARQVAEAVQTADLLGIPDAETLRLDNAHFGLLAEMQHLASQNRAQCFTSFLIARQLHDVMPFLRPVLQGLPFLAVVGSAPDLARRLGHFCGIEQTCTILVPTTDSVTAPEEPSLPQRIAQLLAELEVPFRGALFLVAVQGPYGPIFGARIKTLGGIAIDIASIAPSWTR